MMQIGSLTKSGKVTGAKALTCITGMFSVEQSVFIVLSVEHGGCWPDGQTTTNNTATTTLHR
jgi:hypothetical protein